MSGTGSFGPYWTATAIAAALLVALCLAARRRPGRWTTGARRTMAVLLLAEQVSWQLNFLVHDDWTIHSSIPLDLCDVMAFVAAAACWWLTPLLVELTWFYGLAGTLQAVVTPDVGAPWPHPEFVNYVVEHLVIVMAAVFLVVGLDRRPRRGSVVRMFLLFLVYAGVVGAVDAGTGADYLFLRNPPGTASLLDVLGPWPWYLASCAGLAVALFAVLDAPFAGLRRRAARTHRGVAAQPHLGREPSVPVRPTAR